MTMTLPARGRDVLKFPQVIEDIRQGVERGEYSSATKAALESSDLWTAWVELAKPCSADGKQQPVLCAITRSNGEPNFNHLFIIDYSRSLARDAWHMLRRHPRVYVDHAGSSVFTFLGTPSWDYFQAHAVHAQELHGPLGRGAVVRADGQLSRHRAPFGNVVEFGRRVSELDASSLPLLIVVAVGSTFIVLAGAVMASAIGAAPGRRQTGFFRCS